MIVQAQAQKIAKDPGDLKKSALRFIVLLGLVSLLADVTYEGARSITGPYLAILGATATVVGFVAGLGELIGFGLRIVSGYISDRTGRYWTIAITGYVVNLLAVPLLALAGRWEVAALLMIAERTGKAIRAPARDAMLSHATKQVGRGFGFGLHEALDQIGAVVGPVVIAIVLSLQGRYQTGFAVLLIPALMALCVLVAARAIYPHSREFEVRLIQPENKGFPRVYWIYLAAVAAVAAGYADFPLIAYHFRKTSLVADNWIPIFYAVAMAVDAPAALLFGRLFDRFGIPVLIAASLLSSLFAPLAFFGGFGLALAGIVLWGIGMGAQESVMRAAIAEMVPADKRGSAYGVFNTGYGLFWFLGSALMGGLYDLSIPALVIFSVVAQLVSVPLLLWVRKESAIVRMK
jgi:MFS family permease